MIFCCFNNRGAGYIRADADRDADPRDGEQGPLARVGELARGGAEPARRAAQAALSAGSSGGGNAERGQFRNVMFSDYPLGHLQGSGLDLREFLLTYLPFIIIIFLFQNGNVTNGK